MHRWKTPIHYISRKAYTDFMENQPDQECPDISDMPVACRIKTVVLFTHDVAKIRCKKCDKIMNKETDHATKKVGF